AVAASVSRRRDPAVAARSVPRQPRAGARPAADRRVRRDAIRARLGVRCMNDLGVDRARLAADAPHVRAARWEATLWPAEHAGRPLLVKDVRHAHPLYRFTVGRWLLAGEARVYARMRELPFVPHCHGWLDRDGLILERLDAVTLTRYPEQALLPGFFDQLAAQVAMLHERFIAHL